MVQILQKLLHILNKDQKRKVAGLGVMIFIGALMEMIGVGLIMPVVEGVMAPDQLLNKWYIQILERFIHFDTPNQWLLFLIGVIIAVYFIKNGYLLLQTYVQSRFVNTNQSNTISYMLEEYLNRPYEFYLNADIPTIFRTIDGDVPKVFTTLMEYIQLATELMVSAVLCVTLLVTNPTMTIFIVVVMGGTTVVILKILKPTLNRLGRTSQRLQSQMGKWRLQSIYGIKDVKILNKEHYFASSFGKYSQENAKLTTEYAVLNNMPRLLLETLSICGILGYLAICILNSADMTELVPQISAFAVAAMRLMPSVNRINTHMSNIAFYEPSVNYVYENVDFTSYRLHGKYEKDYDPHTPPMELKKEIRMEDVSYTYPESDKVILDHAQMLVPVGKSVGVMGPSGAGKSTAIDILMGLLQVQGGEILCDGRNIFENYPSWLSHIGYIPQTIYLTDDSIRENIAFGVAKEDIDDERVWHVLEEAQLKDFVKELPGMLDMEIGERGVRLSGGQRQRLGIARALYHNPEILVFDEATSALDTDTETAIMEAIESFHGKKTLVIIAHIAEELCQSEFAPVDFELPVGEDGVPALSIPLPDGGRVSIDGKVDRVDLLQRDGVQYLRVVDYKTGKKEFKLSDVIYGVNMQMLIYLATLSENAEARYGGNLAPAGILYVPASRPTLSVARGTSKEKVRQEETKKLRMNGLLIDDPDILHAMEPDGAGTYIPVTIKNGAPARRDSVVSPGEMDAILRRVKDLAASMAEELHRGRVAAVPLKGDTAACQWCPYFAVCGREQEDAAR